MLAPDPTAKRLVLDLLCQSSWIWRGREFARPPSRSTGFDRLDGLLPGGGWPIGALTEIAPSCMGIGELSITLPALRALCQLDRNVCLIQPPYTPYAPALLAAGVPLTHLALVMANDEQSAHWAAEELLREGKTGAVLIWSESRDDRRLRRLQLAAETGRSLAFLYRRPDALRDASPAALRLALIPRADAIEVLIVKARGGHPSSTLLNLPRIRTW